MSITSRVFSIIACYGSGDGGSGGGDGGGGTDGSGTASGGPGYDSGHDTSGPDGPGGMGGASGTGSGDAGSSSSGTDGTGSAVDQALSDFFSDLDDMSKGMSVDKALTEYYADLDAFDPSKNSPLWGGPNSFDPAVRSANEHDISYSDIAKGIDVSYHGYTGFQGMLDQAVSTNFGHALGEAFGKAVGAAASAAIGGPLGMLASLAISEAVSRGVRDAVENDMVSSFGEESVGIGFSESSDSFDGAGMGSGLSEGGILGMGVEDNDFNNIIDSAVGDISAGGITINPYAAVDPTSRDAVISHVLAYPEAYKNSKSKAFIQFIIKEKFRDVFGKDPFEYAFSAAQDLLTLERRIPKVGLDEFAINQEIQKIVSKLF